ncbi:MAG TPA: hypothetical protein VJB82_00335 [Candidatus Peribacterales bacterium]|nr:hypothetical protein [Candidatus Peribacterales bacterium]
MQYLTLPFPPHAYTILGLGAIAFFFLHGATRGIFKELFSITGLIASYPLAKPFGWALTPLLSLERIPTIFHKTFIMALGGIVAYGTLWVLFLFLTRLLKLERRRYGWDKFIVASSGCLVGGVFGTLIVFVGSWFILLLSSILSVIPASAAEKEGSIFLLPTAIIRAHGDAFRTSALGTFAQKTNPLLHTFDVGISLATQISTNPKAMQTLMAYPPVADIIDEPVVRNLIANPDIQAMAKEGNMIGIMNHPSVQEMLNDPEVQKKLQEIDPSALKALLEKK